MTKRPVGLVRKGKPPPGPKVPPMRESMIAMLKGLASHHADDQAAADLAAFLHNAERQARSILADRSVEVQAELDQAQMLLDRIAIIQGGIATGFTGWGTEHYLLAALDVGAFLQDLGGFYRQQDGRRPLYDERHFSRMEVLIGKDMPKRKAAIQTLRETDRTLPDDQLKNRSRGLSDAYEASRGIK